MPKKGDQRSKKSSFSQQDDTEEEKSSSLLLFPPVGRGTPPSCDDKEGAMPPIRSAESPSCLVGDFSLDSPNRGSTPVSRPSSAVKRQSTPLLTPEEECGYHEKQNTTGFSQGFFGIVPKELFITQGVGVFRGAHTEVGSGAMSLEADNLGSLSTEIKEKTQLIIASLNQLDEQVHSDDVKRIRSEMISLSLALSFACKFPAKNTDILQKKK